MAQICKVADCGGEFKARGYCLKHWAQVNRHGKVFTRTFRTPNEIVVAGDTARIILYKGISQEPFAEAIIDAADVKLVEDMKWNVYSGYCKTQSKGLKGLHEVITGSQWIDHIDGNKLNNRRSNLRPVTNMQNSWNSSKKSFKKSSKYKGVFPCNMTKKPWRSYIKVDGINIFIGRFYEEAEAANMYDQYAIQLYGEYARPNFEYLPIQ